VPRRCPVESRHKLLNLIEPVAEIAAQLGVSDHTICNWLSLGRIDRGQRVGVSTSESAAPGAGRRRIRELKTEIVVVKRAEELLKAQTNPRGGVRSLRRS